MGLLNEFTSNHSNEGKYIEIIEQGECTFEEKWSGMCYQCQIKFGSLDSVNIMYTIIQVGVVRKFGTNSMND